MWCWSGFLSVSSGWAGSDQSFPSVNAHQREEDQYPEPATAEHAGGAAAPLCFISGKRWNTLSRASSVVACDQRCETDTTQCVAVDVTSERFEQIKSLSSLSN